MKKIIAFILVFSLFYYPLTVQAYEEDTKISYTISELEFFLELSSCSDIELSRRGLTSHQISYIREFDLLQEVKKRAELTQNELQKIGYSASDISMLKQYSEFDNLADAQVAEILSLATLTFTLNTPVTGSSTYSFYYSFAWSSCPIFIQSDLLAATWAATGSTGNPVNIAINKSLSYLQTTNVSTGGAPPLTDDIYSWEPVHEYSSAKLKFSMGYNLGEGISYWTQSGKGKLVLNAVVFGSIYEVYLKIGYGHSVVLGTPSVTFTGTGPSIGFTFGWTTQNLKTFSVRYRYNGVKIS